MSKVSLQDVAKRCGVSHVTVSRILNGKDHLHKAETVERVLAVSKEMGYRPNLLAKSTLSGRTRTVGFLYRAGDGGWTSDIQTGIHEELVASNYFPITLSLKPGVPDLDQVHHLLDRRVDGVIIRPSYETPMAEYLEMDEEEREDIFPYIWAVNKTNRLIRVLVAAELVGSAEERIHFWRTLKSIAGLSGRVDPEAIANQVRAETSQKLAQGFMAMLSGEGGADLSALVSAAPAAGEPGAPSGNGAGGFEAAWIEKSECTACDECTQINPSIFEYDADKKAFVKNAKGGPFKDIVRAAEKCTGACIHPGTPADPGEKNVEKLIKRAEKFQ